MPVRETDDDPFGESTDGGGTIGLSDMSYEPVAMTEPQSPTAASQPDEAGGVEMTEEEEPLPEFDPRWREEFEGLLFVGQLRKTVKVFGHKITLQTIKTEEEIEVGSICKEYADSLASTRVYQSAMCAAAIIDVDGTPLPQPLTTIKGDTRIRNAFSYLIENYHPPVINAIYEEYLLLEALVERVLAAMGEARG